MKRFRPATKQQIQIDRLLSFQWYQVALFLTAQLKIHSILTRSQNAARKYEVICILESSTGGTAVAVNKRDDTIFVKVPSPTGIERQGKKGGGEGGWGKFKLITKYKKFKYGSRRNKRKKDFNLYEYISSKSAWFRTFNSCS